MYIVTTVFNRPNIETAWWTHRPKYLIDNVENAYKAGDLILFESKEITSLMHSTHEIWRDRQAWDNWIGNNPIVESLNRLMFDYYDRVGVSIERTEIDQL